jgi:hypothetical protein
MKLAFFIQSHRDPGQIVRLVRAIKSGVADAVIVVGFDTSSSNFDESLLKEFSDTYLLRGLAPVRRGELSAIRPYFDAIEWLHKSSIEFDWLAYISGQCYPVQPLSSLSKFLEASSCDGFINHFDVLGAGSCWSIEEGYGRYFFHKSADLPDWSMVPAKVANKIGLLSPFPQVRLKSRESFGVSLWKAAPSSPFNEALRCYGGNHRHILSRSCVDYLRSYLRDNDEVVNYFSRTWCPEEAIVQTILANNSMFSLVDDNLIYDDYAASRDGSPRVIGINDYDLITSGKYFFARKVDPDRSRELLDRLDQKILQ